MSPPNKGLALAVSKLLAVQLSIFDSCLTSVCNGQVVTGVKVGCW